MENLTPIVEETLLKVKGATAPTTIYMITDSHILLCDETDEPWLREYFTFARQWFIDNSTRDDEAEAHHIFEAQLDLVCREKPDVTVFTGDTVGAPTDRGIRYLTDACRRVGNYIYIPGNHDWIPQKAVTDTGDLPEEARAAAVARFASVVSPEDFEFQVREVNGVLLIGMNTSNYQASARQVAQLKEQFRRGLPCVLFLHIPVYTEALGEAAKEGWGAPLATGVPDACFSDNTPPSIAKILKADENSRAFMELISRRDIPLCAIFAGHLHFSHASALTNGIMQYVVNMGYNGAIRKIEILPQD